MFEMDSKLAQFRVALAESLKVNEKYSEALDVLDKENKFLTDTLLNAKLGKITTDRRTLQAKIIQVQTESDKIKQEAYTVKSEYEQKLDKIAFMIKEVKSKQDDIDSYIDTEAEKKIFEERTKYKKLKSDNNKALELHKTECNDILNKHIAAYKEKRRNWIIITICSVIFGITGIAINFL